MLFHGFAIGFELLCETQAIRYWIQLPFGFLRTEGEWLAGVGVLQMRIPVSYWLYTGSVREWFISFRSDE